MKVLTTIAVRRVIFQLLALILFHCHGQEVRNSTFLQRTFDAFIASPYRSTTNESTIELASASTSVLSPYDSEFDEISRRCPKNSLYGSFNPEHRRALTDMTNILLDVNEKNPERPNILEEILLELKQLPAVHPKLWFVSYLTSLLQTRPNALQLNKPSAIELFPTSFFTTPVLEEKTSEKECALLDERFGADNGYENRLWYFRESALLNAHHWNWHLRHPTFSNMTIDRRGESFYFFHHDLLARYKAERLSNDLNPTVPLDIQLETIIEEGYKPHLKDGISGSAWSDRKPFRQLHEALDDNFRIWLTNLTIERDRVLDTINQAGVIHSKGFVEISDHDRVNILGELVEASIQSINPEHYGMAGYHGRGHILISMVDAIEGVPGVIIDLGTTARDPVFYRWHEYIDLVFQAYKLTLLKPHMPSSGEYPLIFKGIKVTDVSVVQEAESEEVPLNHLETFWNIRRIELGRGIDFNNATNSSSPVVNICAKHLDHEKFYHEIEIENSHIKQILGTVRIFMAPRYKSSRRKTRYTMAEQRSLFFAMDSFQTLLDPGKNVIVRRSIDNSLTADWPKSLKELNLEKDTGVSLRSVCECGFPHHLLLPKGREKGMVFDLFVMVTNGIEDTVRNNVTEEEVLQEKNQCPASHIHCGLPGKKYPDSKPMGYPFDRRPYPKPIMIRDPSGESKWVNMEVHNLEAYTMGIPNMFATQVVIQHHNEIRGQEFYEEAENLKPIRLKKL